MRRSGQAAVGVVPAMFLAAALTVSSAAAGQQTIAKAGYAALWKTGSGLRKGKHSRLCDRLLTGRDFCTASEGVQLGGL